MSPDFMQSFRMEIATRVMLALIQKESPQVSYEHRVANAAEDAVAYADALLAELNKPKKEETK